MDSIKYITVDNVTYEIEGSGGGVSTIKVGDTSYIPNSNGVISLPEYPEGGEAGYSILPALLGGTAASLVSTGEKYIWNNKQDTVTVSKGTPQLAWNTEVTLGTVKGVAITAKLPLNPAAGLSDIATRLAALERIVASYHQEQPSGDGNYYSLTIVENENNPIPPSVSTLSAYLDPNATKPVGINALNKPSVLGPTTMYFIYPLDWEVVENNVLSKPIIKDPNGYSLGIMYDENTPTITVNNKIYRVALTQLGSVNYTVEF